MAEIIRFPRVRAGRGGPVRPARPLAPRYNRDRMATRTESITEAGARFCVGDWFVEPSLNRISRGSVATQVERKAMDVLVYLAGRAGEVVDRRELQDAIWETEFVSYNTVAARIYELREALEDDAKAPRYIETIPKRGYRLIATVRFSEVPEPDAGVLAESLREQPDERSPYPGLEPFTDVDAEDFFGREAEIAALWRKIASRRLLAVVGPLRRGQELAGAGRGGRQGAAGLAGGGLPARRGSLPGRGEGAGAGRGGRRRGDAAAAGVPRPRRGAGRGGAVAGPLGRGAARGRPVRGALHPQPGAGAGALRRAAAAAGGRGRDPRRAGAAGRLPARLPPPPGARADLQRSDSGRTAGRQGAAAGADRAGGEAALRLRERVDGRRDGGGGGGGAGGAAAARLRGVAAVGAAGSGATAADAGGVRADRRGRRGAGAARGGDAGEDRTRAAADRARAVPQPGDGAGDAGGARVGRASLRVCRFATRIGPRGAAGAHRRAAADLVRGRRGRRVCWRGRPQSRDRARVAAAGLAAARALADPGCRRCPAPRPAPPGGADLGRAGAARRPAVERFLVPGVRSCGAPATRAGSPSSRRPSLPP